MRELAKQDGMIDKNIGSVDTLNLQPQNIIDAFYETPMVAHHAMEPMNCVAHVQGDKVEIWTSSQVPSTITGSGANDLQRLLALHQTTLSCMQNLLVAVLAEDSTLIMLLKR